MVRLTKIASTLLALIVLCRLGTNATAKELTYVPRSEEEVGILSLIVGSEIKANDWPTSRVVCFTVEGLDPSAKLAKSLRERYSSVRSSAEWKKKFNCTYELQLSYTNFDLSGDIKIRSKVLDLREINTGQAHFAVLVRDGEYSIQKLDGKWITKAYVPKPLS
jgi:hypothetical protein